MKLLITKEFLREFLRRFKVGETKELYNPTNCYSGFYLVAKFEDWIDIIIDIYKEGGEDIFLQNDVVHTYKIISNYNKSLREYHKAYKYFANEILLLNELSLKLYNDYKVDGNEKVTSNHSPKLLLPYSTYLYNRCEKILIKDVKLPKSFDVPDRHKGYSNYLPKRKYIELAYSSFLSIHEDLSTQKLYVNEI